jgi:predicted metalloprotease with PDZ domain
MRIIIQQIADGVELCARLGLLLAPEPKRLAPRIGPVGFPRKLRLPTSVPFDGQAIRAVLPGSPCERAGLVPSDVVVTINNVRLDSVRHLTFTDRRPSELNLLVFIAGRFTLEDVRVRVPPEPYRPIENIVAEAMRAAAALSELQRGRA